MQTTRSRSKAHSKVRTGPREQALSGRLPGGSGAGGGNFHFSTCLVASGWPEMRVWGLSLLGFPWVLPPLDTVLLGTS